METGQVHIDLTLGKDTYQTVSSTAIGMSDPFSLGAAPTMLEPGTIYVPAELFQVLLGNREGTVSIGDIRHWGRELTSIEPLVRQTARTVRVGDEAKESFDYLLDSGANYVVVLNADDTIAGIVTKTSVARSVAENLWGDSK